MKQRNALIVVALGEVAILAAGAAALVVLLFGADAVDAMIVTWWAR